MTPSLILPLKVSHFLSLSQELRLEDYVANRKGGTGTGILGMGMTQQDSKSSGLFGQANTTSGFTFGTQSKPLFGGATTGRMDEDLKSYKLKQSTSSLFVSAINPSFVMQSLPLIFVKFILE